MKSFFLMHNLTLNLIRPSVWPFSFKKANAGFVVAMKKDGKEVKKNFAAHRIVGFGKRWKRKKQ